MKLQQRKACVTSLCLLLSLLVYCVHANPITQPNYIRPWPVEWALGTGIPHAVEGKCNKGAVYTISTVQDLLTNMTELTCIYVAGTTPSTIPLGPYYGTVLKVSTSDTLAPIGAAMWKGKLAFETMCPKPLKMLMNWVNNRLIIAAVLKIEDPKLPLAEGEYNDHKPSLILDYTQDFSKLCTTPPGSLYGNDHISLNLFNNIWPFSQIVDTVRLVGRQEDGGRIYLGKTYLIDPFSADTRTFNIAYWSFVNYDDRVSNLKPGQSLPPLPHGFDYMEPGILQVAKQVLPFDNLLVDPGSTLEGFFKFFDAFANVIASNLGSDMRREFKRYNEKVSAHTQFWIGCISGLLAKYPSLTNGLTPQKFAENLLNGTPDQVGEEKQKSVGKGGGNSRYNILKPINNLVNILTPQQKPSDSMLVGAQSQKNENDGEVNAALNSTRTTLLQLAEELRNSAFEDVSNTEAIELPPIASEPPPVIADSRMLKKA